MRNTYITTKTVKSAILPKVIAHRSLSDCVQKVTKFGLLGVKIDQLQVMCRFNGEISFVVFLGWCVLCDFFVE